MDHSRRKFIKNLGSLTVGFSFFSVPGGTVGTKQFQTDLPGSLRRFPQIDSWLEVLQDDRIRVYTGKVELGQGIGIVIRQMAAEEMSCVLDKVEVVHADTALTPNEGYTAGSGSVKASAIAVRYAAAAAREKLLDLASSGGKVDRQDLKLNNGIITDSSGRQVASISELLAGKKWNTEVALPVPLKSKEDYQFVGKAIKGNQLFQTITGKPYFINDLRFENMLHAMVIKPPIYSAVLSTVETDEIRSTLPGGVDLIIDGDFVAVTASSEFTVMQAAESVSRRLKWMTFQLPCSNEDLEDWMVSSATTTESVADRGEINLGELKEVSGTFFKPYIMHGSMAPACGIARYSEGQLEVWSHSQGVFPLRSALASMTGLDEEKIRVIGVPGAGCFGHNSSDDAAAEAVIIAMARPGRHVKIQWSRFDEHRWEALGSAMRMQISGGVDSQGKIQFWQAEIWTDSHSQRPNSDAGTLLPARYTKQTHTLQGRGYLGGGYRNAEPYYQIPVQKIKAHFFDGPLRVSSLRSLGAFANVFAIESVIEEMAKSVEMHPLDFRIKNLEDRRAIAVLEALKNMTAQVIPDAKEGLGFGFSRYKNNDGYCAVAVHLRATSVDRPIVLKVWAVADAGEIMNQDGLRKQIEGGVLQALSWTLMEEVKFDQERIKSIDWVRYPVLHFAESPEVEVVLLDHPDEPPFGGGEMAVPPTPAAVTNALYQATGQRIYRLPLRRS
ncbi:MAG: xanthine dehydrogenase family protein molybdopterin-binding subunit [Saprospiraceae bacterium]|nr:xanthine dehydrogenase family protein molybdopterin-binding subunit [Saprospiraceae bacterium]